MFEHLNTYTFIIQAGPELVANSPQLFQLFIVAVVRANAVATSTDTDVAAKYLECLYYIIFLHCELLLADCNNQK